MFFLLSKTIGMLSSPANWLLALAIFSVFLKDRNWNKMASIALLCFTLLFTNMPFYSWVAKKWAYPVTPIAALPQHSVAIVLGGAAKYDAIDTNRIFLNENSGDRILHSFQLYKQGMVKKVIFTSGSAALTGVKKSEASFVKKLYYLLGMPLQDLITEEQSRNTYENALFTKAILDTLTGDKKYILVTNALHMKRGLACFKKLGVECTPFPVDNEGFFDTREWHEWVIPKMYVLGGWERLSHEFFGYLAYKFKGYC